ncbi:hypothetical protein CDO26_36530 (plasmid) [Sinorhizobium meliloti]|nr:hypothetical protein CDO26_36530 [Sinorhizobium meliloti]
MADSRASVTHGLGAASGVHHKSTKAGGGAGGLQGVLPNRRGGGAALDRQHIGQQLGRGGIGHERWPPRFQIEALGRNVVGDQFPEWIDRCRTVSADHVRQVVSGAFQADVGKESIERYWITFLAAQATSPPIQLAVFAQPEFHLRRHQPIWRR